MGRTITSVMLFLMLGFSSCNYDSESKTIKTATSPASPTTPLKKSPPRLWIGSLQMKQKWMSEDRQAGINVTVLSVIWDRFEPQEGKWSEKEITRIRSEISAARSAGLAISVDFGLQYPPKWVFDLPNSRFRNQYGDEYVGPNPGSNGFNTVFVQANRDRVERYIKHFFKEFGTDFQSIRLGWGYYGELNYPFHGFKGKNGEKVNCYWSFGDIALGKKPGLPTGISKCPVPDWKPGDPSPNGEAQKFIDWYMGAMQNFHDWQINFTRSQYPGLLCMLYPSWGIRPGWIDAAVAGNLNGETSPEKNGEIQRGYDFARFINGINDPKVVVYCTWIDAKTWRPNDDQGSNVASWSPIRFLSQLAKDHQPQLAVWGENTGPGKKDQMDISFQRARDYGLIGVVWAFDPQLHDGKPGNATLKEFSVEISKWEKSN